MFSFEMRREEYRVRRILTKLDQEAEIYRSFDTLSRRFERPRGDICLMIFLIGRIGILNNLILLKNQMYDLPIVLVLPNTDRETILKGHKFYPRFITFVDGDYSDLSLALQNIVHQKCVDHYEETGEEMQMDSNLR